VSLLIHAALGVLTIALHFRFNAHLYRSDWQGSGVTLVEGLCYALAVGSVCMGWYFNVHYVMAYPAQASWAHFTRMLFDNPAAASAGQDMIITNLLFPLARGLAAELSWRATAWSSSTCRSWQRM